MNSLDLKQLNITNAVELKPLALYTYFNLLNMLYIMNTLEVKLLYIMTLELKLLYIIYIHLISCSCTLLSLLN